MKNPPRRIYCTEVIYLEERQNQITYDENWQSVSEPEYPAVVSPGDWSEPQEPAHEQEHTNRGFHAPKQPVLTMQLIICLLLGLAAFAVKGLGGVAYAQTRAWYYHNLNDTAVFDGARQWDFQRFFTATADEAQNTANGN